MSSYEKMSSGSNGSYEKMLRCQVCGSVVQYSCNYSSGLL